MSHQTRFSFKLTSVNPNDTANDNISLKRFVFHEIQNGRASFILRSPNPGTYYLKVFAKRIDDRVVDRNRFMEIITYKVQIDPTCFEDEPLPDCWDVTWGPGTRAERYCLHPVQQRGHINTSEKTINLEINKTRPVQILCRFCRNDWREGELKKCLKIQDNETKAYIGVSLPASGEYGLEIYAMMPTKPEMGFVHVCQYLISCQRRDDEITQDTLMRFLIPSKRAEIEQFNVSYQNKLKVETNKTTHHINQHY